MLHHERTRSDSLVMVPGIIVFVRITRSEYVHDGRCNAGVRRGRTSTTDWWAGHVLLEALVNKDLATQDHLGPGHHVKKVGCQHNCVLLVEVQEDLDMWSQL